MSSTETLAILRAVQRFEDRLTGIEDMLGYTGIAMLDLLAAMTEDEKV